MIYLENMAGNYSHMGNIIVKNSKSLRVMPKQFSFIGKVWIKLTLSIGEIDND
jgi:hypothetical protein